MRLKEFMQKGGRKFNDPYYDQTDTIAAQKVGIPLDVLRAIRLAGERSNENQISSAGARGVYQFIPSTRNAVLKKYGVDAWNPEQASLAAAYLLKENAQRNNNDYGIAIREYHGGSNRENWGSVNKDYINRVQNFVSGQNYTSQNTPQPPEYMQAPDTSHYNDLIAGMSKGLWDWTDPRSQELFQKAPQMVELGLKTYQTQQDLDRRSQLDNERIQQEQIKQQVEQENAQLQQAILAKKQERDQLLSMIPQAKSVSDGPTQVSM